MSVAFDFNNKRVRQSPLNDSYLLRALPNDGHIFETIVSSYFINALASR